MFTGRSTFPSTKGKVTLVQAHHPRRKRSSTTRTASPRYVGCHTGSSLVGLASGVTYRGQEEAICRGAPSEELRKRRIGYLSRSFKVTHKAKAAKTQSSLTTARGCFDKALNYLGIDLVKDLLIDTRSLPNRDILRNVFRMVLQHMAEFDPKGLRREQRVKAATITRYARVVMRDLCDCDIDAQFLAPTIEEWGEGYDREGVALGEERRITKKAGITPTLLTDMIRCWTPSTSRSERSASEEQIRELKFMGQVAAVTLFSFVMRRSEGFSGTERNTGVFNGWIGFSRDHAEWRDIEGKVVTPNAESLKRLERSGGFLLLYPPITKTDQLGRIHGDNPTPFPVGPIRKRPKRFLDVTKWMRKLEERWPVLTKGERRSRPMFFSPITGEQISVGRFDKWAMNAILQARTRAGASVTLAEVKREYSLKSFRIGGLNAYDECEVPLKFRKRAGRWLRAESMESYLRLSSLKDFARYTEMQDHEDTSDKTLSSDLPMFQEERENRIPGMVVLQPTSSITFSQKDWETIRQQLEKLALTPAEG